MKSFLYPLPLVRKPAVLLLAGEQSDQLAETIAETRPHRSDLQPRDSSAGTDQPSICGRLADQHTRGPDRTQLAGDAGARHFAWYRSSGPRNDVDPGSIRAAAQGVSGIWLLLAAAVDPRISQNVAGQDAIQPA